VEAPLRKGLPHSTPAGLPLPTADDKVDEADAVAAGLARFIAASEALWERHRAVREGRKLVVL